jgi:hypothetical protein
VTGNYQFLAVLLNAAEIFEAWRTKYGQAALSRGHLPLNI